MKLLRSIQRLLLRPFFRGITDMPGVPYYGRLPALSSKQLELSSRLKATVHELADNIGERNSRSPDALAAAVSYLSSELAMMGYTVGQHPFVLNGVEMVNLDAAVPGTSEEIIVIAAHYDTVFGSPGADDNATGVAATLELARLFKNTSPHRTIRFAFFANEECPADEPWESMGSYVYARRCREKNEKIVGVLSLEMLGVYSDKENSQSYPWPFNLFYPSVGNFIAFVGNQASRAFVRECVGSFRAHACFPCEGAAAPSWASDANRSDHWSFWQFGYPGLMVTDTSNFRYRYLHTAKDTPDKVDFERLTLVCDGVCAVVANLAW